MNKDFLRIGIPKTASVSIESSGLIKEKNKTIRPILARDIKNIKDFFSFAIVRNPYEKVLSTYFYWTKVGNSRGRSDSFYKFTKKYPTFESFIMDYENSEALEIYQSSEYTQWKFITDIDDNIIIDFVGRFDNLEEDFKKCCLC